MAHHRELHAVEGEQFVQGQAQRLRDQHVDFQQRLAVGVVAAQGAVALPCGGEVGEEVLGQDFGTGVIAAWLDGPALVAVVHQLGAFRFQDVDAFQPIQKQCLTALHQLGKAFAGQYMTAIRTMVDPLDAPLRISNLHTHTRRGQAPP